MLTGDDHKIQLAPHSEYFIDPSGTASFKDASEKHGKYKQYSENSFQFGFTRGAVWIRSNIKKADAMPPIPFSTHRLVFDNAALGSITLYVPVTVKGIRKTLTVKGGWMNPDSTIDSIFPFSTYNFPDTYDDSRPLYIRVRTPYAIQFSATVYSENSFLKMSFLLMVLIGICTGILIAMFLYNLVIYSYIRDHQYLYYILYVLSQLLYQSVLFGLVRYAHYSLGSFLLSNILLLTSCAVIFILLFTISYLDTKKTAPIHDIILKVLIFISIVIFFLSICKLRWISNIALYIHTQITVIACISAGISSYRFGFKPALYFIMAFVVLAISTVIFVLRVVAIVPDNAFTLHAVFFGSALESILLSFALGYRIRIMRDNEKSLTEMSITDDLTGLFNKRHFNSVFQSRILESHRKQIPLSLLVLDVDHFKHYNDTYGHQEGDMVLRVLGTVIKETLRGDDTPCRYGGEEFTIILPNSQIDAGMLVAERIRSRFEEKIFTPGKNLLPVTVTVSIGVGTLQGEEKGDTFFKRCDSALYTAKRTGRNRVVQAPLHP